MHIVNALQKICTYYMHNISPHILAREAVTRDRQVVGNTAWLDTPNDTPD